MEKKRDSSVIESERKRSKKACYACRKKKSKCSGEQPTCLMCLKSNKECKYDPIERKRGPVKGAVKQLEKKLDNMESMIKIYNKNPQPILSNDACIQNINHEQGHKNQTIPGVTNSPDSDTGISTIKFQGKEAFYGESSELQFINKLSKNSLGTEDKSFKDIENKLLYEKLELKELISIFTDELLETSISAYFGYVNINFPVLDEYDFRKNYVSGNKHKGCCLLYIVCSLGIRYTDNNDISIEEKEVISKKCYFWSKKAALLEIESTDEILIPIFLLIFVASSFIIFEYCKTWIYPGIAIRLAIDSGYHRDLPVVFNSDNENRNRIQRAKTWLCCYMVDRLMSFVTGRPLAINEGEFDHKVFNGKIMANKRNSLDSISNYHIHIPHLRYCDALNTLFGLFGEVYHKVYSLKARIKLKKKERSITILVEKLKGVLADWYSTHLSSEEFPDISNMVPFNHFKADSNSKYTIGQKMVLINYFHTLKILLLRSMIPKNPDKLDKVKNLTVHTYNFDECLRSANYMTSLISTNIESFISVAYFPFYLYPFISSLGVLILCSANTSLFSDYEFMIFSKSDIPLSKDEKDSISRNRFKLCLNTLYAAVLGKSLIHSYGAMRLVHMFIRLSIIYNADIYKKMDDVELNEDIIKMYQLHNSEINKEKDKKRENTENNKNRKRHSVDTSNLHKKDTQFYLNISKTITTYSPRLFNDTTNGYYLQTKGSTNTRSSISYENIHNPPNNSNYSNQFEFLNPINNFMMANDQMRQLNNINQFQNQNFFSELSDNNIFSNQVLSWDPLYGYDFCTFYQ